ncbi:MAG: DUF3105 domain-containing protein [Candidatus Levybacteria bacterium]|nr:DUF3105 domain-containing protein [Candidatus Levybacteria bacterium]
MEEELSKKEKIRLKHELERARMEQGEKTKRLFFLVGGAVVVVVLGLLGWLFFQKPQTPQKPKPGREVADLGRQHVTDISGVTYNSNPPTSGAHFGVWAKAGTYSGVFSDGYLIHSLEHGYVILSYNCAGRQESEAFASASAGMFSVAKLADSKMSAFTPDNPPAQEIGLPESFQSDACKQLAGQLSSFLKEFDRVIVVPRPQMEHKIALTAWARIDTMDAFDEQEILSFITTFHNAGPEKTAE